MIIFLDKIICEISSSAKSYKKGGNKVDKADISFEKYYEDVLRFLRGLSRDEYLAEELAQETMFRAIKSIRTFNGDCELRVWLCTIAKNLFFTYCKRQKRLSYEETCENFEAEEELFVQIIEDREMAFRVHRILHDMKEPYKEVFSLRIFGELSFREIGELFQKSEHWACVTYHRARGMIQGQIRE
ncbi:MAG: RNA polymerase sigma factor [Lachnospiraceae bacterium]|nr:RNA polymerase sigma factor [Lachnospiraceae bacterium]